jgi:hypothetical protein
MKYHTSAMRVYLSCNQSSCRLTRKLYISGNTKSRFFQYKNFGISFLSVNKKKILLRFIQDKKGDSSGKWAAAKDGIYTLEISPLEDIPIERIKNEVCDLIECYEKVLQKG